MVSFLQRAGKADIAYHAYQGEDKALPTVLFCGGYRSDMGGTKAIFLEEACKKRGQGYVRFDYRGHGQSGGVFEECVIGDWFDDARAVFDALINGPVVIVGSSMGGWIGLLLALSLRDTDYVRGFVGIAAAPDFTEDMYHTRLNADQQSALMEDGIVYVPNDYSDEPYAFTRAFYEDGKQHLILNGAPRLACPVTLLQGSADIDVPPKTAYAIQQAFDLPRDAVVIIDGGDHRLSAPDQLQILQDYVEKIA